MTAETLIDYDKVICPNCVHQFQAIPVNVQEELVRLRQALSETQKAHEQWVRDHQSDTDAAWRKVNAAEAYAEECRRLLERVTCYAHGAYWPKDLFDSVESAIAKRGHEIGIPYWMIERGSPAEWIEFRPYHADDVAFGSSQQPARWTSDSAKAQRFDSREAAETIIASHPDELRGARATEHLDCPGPERSHAVGNPLTFDDWWKHVGSEEVEIGTEIRRIAEDAWLDGAGANNPANYPESSQDSPLAAMTRERDTWKELTTNAEAKLRGPFRCDFGAACGITRPHTHTAEEAAALRGHAQCNPQEPKA